MRTRIPAEVFPPGDFIRDELDARGWTQSDLAQLIGKSQPAVNELINGKRGVTPETALMLSAAFGTSPDFWMNLEAAYSLAQAHSRIDLNGIEKRAKKLTVSKHAILKEFASQLKAA